MNEHDDAPIACPKCRVHTMNRLNVDGVEIDRCPSCHGLWLDQGEREKLLAARDAPAVADVGPASQGEARDAQRTITCPRDVARMVPMIDAQQRHVRFEQCSVCGGVFLDAGELRDLAEVTWLERLRSHLG